MDKLKLAACGIDCNECGSYKVTVEHDIKAAEGLVEWYRGQGWIGENEGAEAVLKKIPLCKGCWNATDDCFFKCGCHSNRDFRVCCTEKQINHCGECSDFPCEPYIEFVGNLDHHKKAMDYLLSINKPAKEKKIMYRSMMQIYVKNSDQAVQFYQNAFDAKLLCDHRHENGTVAHAELDMFGQVLAICESDQKETVTGNSMQFCLHFGDGKEVLVKKMYNALKEDCMMLTAPITSPGECPWSPCLFGVIDKFGVNWCIFV